MSRLALAIVLAALAGGGPTRGVWTARASRWTVDDKGPTTLLQLSLRPRSGGGDWTVSFPVPVDELRGLGAAQTEASRSETGFTLVRDAGTFAFDGSFVSGEGAGHFTFTPSPEYVEGMKGLGYSGLDAATLFSLAAHDASRALVRELASLGYARLSLDDLTSMGIHGAGPSFIRELKALGYDNVPVDDLVSMRIHGARPEFIRELAGLGYARVPVDDLVTMRIHGVTPAFIRELKALGYSGVAVDDLVTMRIHGVTPDYVRSANRTGSRVSVDRLVEMRIHAEDP